MGVVVNLDERDLDAKKVRINGIKGKRQKKNSYRSNRKKIITCMTSPMVFFQRPLSFHLFVPTMLLETYKVEK